MSNLDEIGKIQKAIDVCSFPDEYITVSIAFGIYWHPEFKEAMQVAIEVMREKITSNKLED
jgi:hypothetical protein